MPKPLKYSDSTPVDDPITKDYKPEEAGSGIKVAPEDKFSEYEKRLKDVESKREKPSKGEMLLKAGLGMMRGSYEPRDETREPKSFISSIGRAGSAAMENKAGGGTASSRADGIATKGKTRGKLC
jgi:hypothetical protein